jgi:prepilin peptidase CpaA
VGEPAIWSASLLLAGTAGIWDWRTRRIPNALTLAGLPLGLVLNAWANHWSGVWSALEGAALVLALLLPLVLLRGLGAGDWKLMGALGALLGPARIILILLATVFLSGLVAFVQVVGTGRTKETLVNLWILVRGFFVYGLLPHPEIRLENPRALSLPFGVVAAVATLFCFWLGQRGG